MNKSKSMKWLGIHSLVYSLPFFYFGVVFGVFTCLSHFLVDFISSRITSKLWEMKEVKWFFTTIGFDQAIHYMILIGTYKILLG
jgi:hypothetical protein